MSLSSPLGRAPLEPADRHTDVTLPERVRYWEPWPRRMRAMLAGRTVVDSRRAVMLWQTGSFPDLYYHRVDIRSSSRHITVRHGERIIADSARPKLLLETGNPVRYYLPFADVDLAPLTRSGTISECPIRAMGSTGT